MSEPKTLLEVFTGEKHPMNTCPVTGQAHTPDWYTISVIEGGIPITIERIGIQCADCGLAGCVGNTRELEESITWEK